MAISNHDKEKKWKTLESVEAKVVTPTSTTASARFVEKVKNFVTDFEENLAQWARYLI